MSVTNDRKIESLTSAQIAKFPEYVARWAAIGLSTEPADRPRAEAAIAKMYAVAGLASPKVVWCGSPFSQGFTRAILMSADASVWASVWDSVGASVWASVGDSVRASVWASVWDSVGASVGASVWDSVYGAHDANWLAFYRFFHAEFGLVKATEKLAGLWELCESAGWALPHERICWVSERHNVLHRNDQGRLHCETGPALAYPDGWRLWCVHGVAVDEQVVMRPGEQTIDQIHADESEERRRIRIERFGWSRYLRESGSELRESRRNDRDAQQEDLYRLQDGTQRIVVTDPSTGRRYALGVPREIETCEQAQDWMSSGLDRFAVHRS